MIKSVNKYQLHQIFSIEDKILYAVPRYQREYAWGKSHWNRLFDDLMDNDPGYFLGSIICINQSMDALGVQRLELVDGQQRLTTLSLLFAAVYHAIKSHEKELDDEQRDELPNLKRKLVLKKYDDQIRIIPQIQNNNQNDYRALLSSEVGVLEGYEVPANAGNRKIFLAYRHFKKRIGELTETSDNRILSIMNFLDKVNQSWLVKIEVDSHADAYMLFESLNNRGLPLTAIDLIKNKLLAKLESLDPGKVGTYFEQWNYLLGCLGDDYSVQERFFRQYYNAFREDLKTIHQVPVATRSNMIDIYEKIIDQGSKDFLGKIIMAGKQYSVILCISPDPVPDFLKKAFMDLERIEGTPSYVLMLFLLLGKEMLKLDDRQITAIVTFLRNFFVRRNLTDTPPTHDLTRIFMATIGKLSGLSGDAILRAIRDQLLPVSAPDETFRTKLEGPVYEENSGVTRFILCALAEQSMTKETMVDLWRSENKLLVWTIEHIFPQGSNIPEPWIEMMAGGNEQEAKRIQESYVHRLGNLTITGFNQKLGNKGFFEKRDRVDQQGRPVGYKNALKLNEDLATAEGWSVAQIEARTKKLVDQAMALFDMGG